MVRLPGVFAFPTEFSGQGFLQQKNSYRPEANMGGKECYTPIKNASWTAKKVSIRLIRQHCMAAAQAHHLHCS